MEELKDKSLHLTAEKLAEELQKMEHYNRFYEDLQVHTWNVNCLNHNIVLNL